MGNILQMGSATSQSFQPEGYEESYIPANTGLGKSRFTVVSM